MKRILNWIEAHQLESAAIVVILAIATYCSVTLTTNAAVNSLNAALAEMQEQVQQRQDLAERALRGAVLDAYPDLLAAERAYNQRFRQGEQALVEQDLLHKQRMEEVIQNYRPIMQAALRSGVTPVRMRRHMEGIILADPYQPAGERHIAAAGSDQGVDQI